MLHHMVKGKAVATYSKLAAAEASREEVMKAISEDEKGFSADDINEIMAAIYAPAEKKEPGEPPPAAVPGNKKGLLQFEKHTARPVYKFRLNEDTGEQERYLQSVEKTSAAPLSVHNMEQRHADELNSHLEISGFYYFPKN